MVGETPNIDRIGNEGAIFMTYYAEQSCTAGRNAFFTGMHPLRTGMIPPQLPGSPSILGPERRRSRSSCSISAIPPASSARTIWATTPRHCRPRTAFRNSGAILPLRCDAGRQLPRHQQTPTEQGIVPPCMNTPVKGLAEPPGAVDPKNSDLPDASSPGYLLAHPRTALRRTRPARIKVR